MKMGVKEFRERFSEVAEGQEPVFVTKNGRIVGRYVPERRKPAEKVDMAAWAVELERSRDEWRERTPDWRERMAAYGLNPDGETLER